MFYFTFHRIPSILLFCFLILFASCYAAFIPDSPTRIIRRQDGTSGVQVVTTTERIPTEAGMFIQTCTVTMTPITGNNGESLVREERSCTLSMDTGSGSSVIGTPAVATSSSTVITLTSSSATGGTSLSPLVVSPAGISATSNAPNPSLTASPSSTQFDGSSVVSSSSSTGTPTSPSATHVSNSSGQSPNNTVVGAAADSASETPFVPPGKHLQVLPIGLGIFAGITVIALIIIGVTTYERAQYRRNFRRRKLAEAGAEMGYGGIAQAA